MNESWKDAAKKAQDENDKRLLNSFRFKVLVFIYNIEAKILRAKRLIAEYLKLKTLCFKLKYLCFCLNVKSKILSMKILWAKYIERRRK